MRFRIGAIVLAGTAAMLFGEAGAGDATPSVTLTGISIHKANGSVRRDPVSSLYARGQTILAFQIADPARYMISIHEQASRFTEFADDKDTDFLKPPAGVQRLPLLHSHVEPDGHRGGFTLATNQTPAVGALKVRVKGTLAVRCGSEAKTDQQKDIALKDGSTFTAASITFTVQPTTGGAADRPEFRVVLWSDEPLESIRNVRFFDSNGTEIESALTGKAYMGGVPIVGKRGKPRYNHEYSLHKKVEEVAVEVSYWGKVETIEVPIQIESGVGF
jgi:hypothetical protein